MSISAQMQSRLDRIDALIKEGHTLEKKWGYYPDLKTSSGKSVNIFGPLFRLSGPAGFSWIAFFFPWAVCAQIREWSYFYFVCIFSLVETASASFLIRPALLLTLLHLFSTPVCILISAIWLQSGVLRRFPRVRPLLLAFP